MDGDVVLRVLFRTTDRQGNGAVALRIGDDTHCVCNSNITALEARAKYVKMACKGRPGVDANDLARELEKVAGEHIESNGAGGETKPTQSAALVNLAKNAEFWRDG